MQVAAERAEAPAEDWPERRSAWYAVGVLALVAMFAQLDLGIVSLLVEPIKRDLGLSDTQTGIVMGFAFIMFYVVLGLPLARYVDRNNRRTILALGIAVWSLATALCGFAKGFRTLFLARMFVGAGESVNGPATFSMLADYFPRDRLPRAIAVMQIGTAAGSGLALLVGAAVIQIVGTQPHVLPLLGVVHSWQITFFTVGLPGLLVAWLMSTVAEPPRRGRLSVVPEKVTMRGVLSYLWSKSAVFGPIFIGLALNMLDFGTRMWTPAFYQRTYGWSAQKTGAITGTLTLVLMLLGLLIGVWAVEWLYKRKHLDAPIRLVVITRLVAVPAAILMPLMPTPELALALQAVGMISIGIAGPAQNAALQWITPNLMRGQVTALYLFLFYVVGSGVGPAAVGLVTDRLFDSAADLRYALVAIHVALLPVALLVLIAGLKPYGREIARLAR